MRKKKNIDIKVTDELNKKKSIDVICPHCGCSVSRVSSIFGMDCVNQCGEKEVFRIMKNNPLLENLINFRNTIK